MRKGLRLFLARKIHRLHEYYLKSIDLAFRQEDQRYQFNRIGRNVWLGDVTLEGECKVASDVILRGNVHLGKYSTIGQECILHGGEIRLGRYCQLGPRVGIYAINHGLNYITTYVHPALFEGRQKELIELLPVQIGNDVWIGHGAIVLPGVTIGNGAIIGAGAVVSQDIPPYGIAVGVPATVIKMRFDQEIINLLLQWQWWNLNPSQLAEYETIFHLAVHEARDQLVIALRSIIK